MKKVGIVSCYFKNNYGSMLQAYATKKVLDNNDIPNETININGNIDFKKGKRKYYLSQIFNVNFIKSKFGMIKMKIDVKLNKELKKNIALRNKKFKDFRREFNLSKNNKTYKELTEMAIDRYTDVVVGSDQLWLPVNIISDYYTLNWVPAEINKISYSTSFGVSAIPKKYNDLYKKFLSRINFLSVREDTGVKIIKDIAEINANLVCDPTILLTKEEWNEVAVSKRIIDDKYILCYFLGNNIEHRKFVERLKKKTGYKIVSLNHADEYVKYSDIFCDVAPYDIGPREWINLIKNAEIVCTDSFHGTVFSLIYNKLFFCFRRFKSNNKVSTNSRLDSLLKIAEINSERILTGLEDVDKVLNYEIDYTKVNENIDNYRNTSKEWLLNSIKNKENEVKHINITYKEECCGCTACMSNCPQNAITMEEDEEGFLYPKIKKEKCVNCGLCKKVCPIINNNNETVKEQNAYAINNKDLTVRKESTSGGAFSAIATYIIENGGVVFGAAFNDKYEVIHTFVDNIKDIKKFRNSKYVQSNLKNTYSEAKKFLDENRLVCYSGTPCQIEGLKKYLKNDYENLFLIDVVCRAVPSPKLLKSYLKYINKKYLKNEKIKNVSFRNKEKYGYKYTQMRVASDNNIYEEGVETDPYLRAFFQGFSIRPSCGECRFKKKYRESDITIWDCFNAEDYSKELDDNYGTTRVLVHSKKGQELFNKIIPQINMVEINVDKAIKNSKELVQPTKLNDNRKQFFNDMNLMPIDKLFDKYFPNNIKVKVEKFFRVALIKLPFYKKIKRIAKKVLKRG